jgi:hypothetical protein
MKKSLTQVLTLLFCLIAICIQAQDIEIGNNYYFKSNINLADLEPKNSSLISAQEEVKQNYIVKVTDVKDGYVSFEFLIFSNPELREKFNKEKEKAIKKFKLKVEDFQRLTNTYFNFFRGFSGGSYTVPIRIRNGQGKFEFNSNLSLGANALIRLSLSRYSKDKYIDFSIGISLTKVDLNKDNSDLGKLGSDFEKIDVLSPTAFTTSLGAVFNLSQNLNAGLYIGWDNISSADNKANWIYNNKRWIGIGINIAFSLSDNKSNGTGTNKPD